MSSSRTPSEISTTPSAGSVSRPVKGGARKAPTVPPIDEQTEDRVAEPVVEQEPKPGFRDPLEFADQLHQPFEELLLAGAGELELAPAPRHPDLAPADDQLSGEQHGEDLEHVRDAPGRQRQRRHAEQQHEQDREALLFEQLDQAADRLAVLALEPAFEFVADLGQGVCVDRRRRGRRVIAALRLDGGHRPSRYPRPPHPHAGRRCDDGARAPPRHLLDRRPRPLQRRARRGGAVALVLRRQRRLVGAAGRRRRRDAVGRGDRPRARRSGRAGGRDGCARPRSRPCSRATRRRAIASSAWSTRPGAPRPTPARDASRAPGRSSATASPARRT